jgi:hypothetical protein
MERLLLAMFRGYLNDDVWKVLAKLSHFYRHLSAKEIKKEMMETLEKEIPVLICKLEKIFPPGRFNPMQYLLVHLPYEAKLDGPQQYRWTYHIERALKNLSASPAEVERAKSNQQNPICSWQIRGYMRGGEDDKDVVRVVL